MEKLVLDWMEQALADFKTAQDMLKTKNYYAAVTYSQQSAEKSLKAVYILLQGKLPPKIHDLVELTRLVNSPSPVVAESEKLSITYLSSRYPGSAPEIPVRYYTEEKAVSHLHEAEVIISWSEKQIK